MTNTLFDGLFSHTDPKRQLAKLEDGRYYSYQDAVDVSGRFANTLTTMKVQPGDRVAVQIPKSIEAIMLYLACVRIGAVFLPLNTAYTPAEVSYFLNDAEPSLFICDPANRKALEETASDAGVRLETLGVWKNHEISAGTMADSGLEAPTEFETVPRQPDDLAAILYTSGTTGRSKGAMLTHDNLLSNSKALADLWRFTKEDVLLHALPIFHTHGLFVATNVTLLSGASMIFQNTFDVDKIIDALPQSTALMGVPTFYTRLLDDTRFNRDLVSHMRLFVSGSAPLLAETHVEFEARTGHRILERYGMTETNMNTSNPYEGDRIAGTVGHPLPGVSLRVCCAETGVEMPQGEIGVLEVKGPNVFPGYWRMPEKTSEEFRDDGFFITGDLGLVDGKGYVHIVGRGKDLIISGGYNIYPKEIELVLDEHESVKESAVIGVPHHDFGEGVVAAIVLAENAAADETGLKSFVESRLARFKHPKRYVELAELPRNTMGKVQKNVLREKFADSFS